ncbi:conserved hypothetical protein [gamma proteobacterium HdN1]|nr:conserved hypothetical protein [gamma proteobacterium HdN1]
MERLSGLDASFIYMETPTMRMQVAFLVICDPANTPGGYSFRKIVDLIDERTRSEPAFRRRLVEIPYNLHHPIWVDDPEFNIMNHVYQYTLPQPGSLRDLGKKLGHVISQPLRRDCPLWEAWVIEGLEGGRYALMLKVHHAAVDGVSGTALIRHLFDPTPEVRHLPDTRTHCGERIPTRSELIAFAMGSRVVRPRGFFELVKDSATVAVRTFLKRQNLGEIRRSAPLSAPRTHFNRRIGPHRDVALVRMPLSEIKAVKNATNATVNDVVLALCGGVLRDYLHSKDDLPQKSLISMVPISVRTEEKSRMTNNQVSGMWATLATHVEDPMERLRIINADTEAAKRAMNPVNAGLLQDWAEYNTLGAFNLAVRLFASSGLVDRVTPVHNTIISNVPGPREPLYLAGSRIETLVPLGPVMEGVGLNISLASYENTVCFSIQADSSLIEDVGEIGALFEPAFLHLKEAAGLLPAGAARAARAAGSTDKTPTKAKAASVNGASVNGATGNSASAKGSAAVKGAARKKSNGAARPQA